MDLGERVLTKGCSMDSIENIEAIFWLFKILH